MEIAQNHGQPSPEGLRVDAAEFPDQKEGPVRRLHVPLMFVVPATRSFKCSQCSESHEHYQCFFKGDFEIHAWLTPSREQQPELEIIKDARLVVTLNLKHPLTLSSFKREAILTVSPLIAANHYFNRDDSYESSSGDIFPLHTHLLLPSYYALCLLSATDAAPHLTPVPPPLIRHIWSFAYGNISPYQGMLVEIPDSLDFPAKTDQWYYEVDDSAKATSVDGEMVTRFSAEDSSETDEEAGKGEEKKAEEKLKVAAKEAEEEEEKKRSDESRTLPSANMVWCELPMYRVTEKEKKKKQTARLTLALESMTERHNCEVSTGSKLLVDMEQDEAGRVSVKQRKMKQGRPPITVRHILSKPIKLRVDITLCRPADNPLPSQPMANGAAPHINHIDKKTCTAGATVTVHGMNLSTVNPYHTAVCSVRYPLIQTSDCNCEDSYHRVCFDGSGHVLMADSGLKPVYMLQSGDWVRVPTNPERFQFHLAPLPKSNTTNAGVWLTHAGKGNRPHTS